MKKMLSILAIASLVLAGCSNGGGKKEPEVELAQGVTDTTVKVANCVTSSGPYAPVGTPFLAGMRAYFKFINDNGGVDGRAIELVNKDDEFDPVKGKACLQEMVEDEKAFAIVGHFGTPVVAATIEDLKEYGIPAVYFATGIGQLYNDNATGRDRNIYPVQPLYKTEGRIMVARLVGNFDAKKIGIIYTNDDAGKDILWGAQQQAKELGIELVEQQVTVASTDVSAAVTAVKEAGVDGIIAGEIQATFPTVVKELAAQAVNKPVITTYVNVSGAMSEAVAAEIAGKFDVYGNGWVSFGPEKADAIALYQEWVKKQSNSDEYAANAYAMTGWIAGHYFTEALKRVDGALTWDNYMTALESAPIENPFGGLISYADGKRLGTQEMNLSKINTETKLWEPLFPLESMDKILGN